jgi:hypothetical protein
MLNIKVSVGVAIGAAMFYAIVFFSNVFALQNSAVGKRAVDVDACVSAVVSAGSIRG